MKISDYIFNVGQYVHLPQIAGKLKHWSINLVSWTSNLFHTLHFITDFAKGLFSKKNVEIENKNIIIPTLKARETIAETAIIENEAGIADAKKIAVVSNLNEPLRGELIGGSHMDYLYENKAAFFNNHMSKVDGSSYDFSKEEGFIYFSISFQNESFRHLTDFSTPISYNICQRNLWFPIRLLEEVENGEIKFRWDQQLIHLSIDPRVCEHKLRINSHLRVNPAKNVCISRDDSIEEMLTVEKLIDVHGGNPENSPPRFALPENVFLLEQGASSSDRLLTEKESPLVGNNPNSPSSDEVIPFEGPGTLAVVDNKADMSIYLNDIGPDYQRNVVKMLEKEELAYFDSAEKGFKIIFGRCKYEGDKVCEQAEVIELSGPFKKQLCIISRHNLEKNVWLDVPLSNPIRIWRGNTFVKDVKIQNEAKLEAEKANFDPKKDRGYGYLYGSYGVVNLGPNDRYIIRRWKGVLYVLVLKPGHWSENKALDVRMMICNLLHLPTNTDDKEIKAGCKMKLRELHPDKRSSNHSLEQRELRGAEFNELLDLYKAYFKAV